MLVLGDQLADLLHRRRVEKRVVDHQGEAAAVRLVDQVQDLVGGLGQRLLDQHVLAGPQRRQRQLVVGMDRRGDRDGIDARVPQQVAEVMGRHDIGMEAPALGQVGCAQVGHADDAGGLAGREIANEVRPPVAVADDADADRCVAHVMLTTFVP